MKSGRPGRRAACRLKESFRDRSRVSHFFSAPVPFECTERIIWLRADLEKVSAILTLLGGWRSLSRSLRRLGYFPLAAVLVETLSRKGLSRQIRQCFGAGGEGLKHRVELVHRQSLLKQRA